MPTPEEEARANIDNLLEEAGWTIQDFRNLNLKASLGIAIREFPLESSGPGRKPSADYLLFVEGKAVGVVEAKPVGTTLSGVAEQSTDYLDRLPSNVPRFLDKPPFAYESTGVETYFRSLRDPESRSRRIFAFHRPEMLKEWAEQEETLRTKLRKLPPLIERDLWAAQIKAIKNLELSFAEDRPRALIQMASGSGKTFTAVNFVYRLVKFAGAKRILFLVDRSNLGKQTRMEFEKFETPDDGRKFTELYNVQRLTSNQIDLTSKVVITTIQRLYSILKGEAEFDPTLEEISLFETAAEIQEPREVTYDSKVPIETFDFMITDECHRSIYNLWRQVLEYFDAYIIGLTATPSKQTIGFFNQNLVMEYGQEEAIVDRVNVGYDIYRISTAITAGGSRVEAGYYIDKRDKQTRAERWQLLDEDLTYPAVELDRSVVANDQIRTIVKTFKEKLFTEIFPGRKEVPKTLVFAKDDSHAEDIVHIIREEFGKGNDFCKKITYRTTGEDTDDLIASFRNSYNPRIAVTVDMISTGTDIKPLECLLFMRDVKSRLFFEQMKGRGARTISETDLTAVTPDARHKTHYVIVDAVGVCESDKTDSRSLERKRTVPFEKLLISIALGERDDDAMISLAGRLARLNNEISESDRRSIKQLCGLDIGGLSDRLLSATDPDKRRERAKETFKTDNPIRDQVAQAGKELAEEACSPFNNPALRETLVELRERNEQIIDTVSKDRILFTGHDERAKERAKQIVGTFKKFIEDNRDELTALQIIYAKPFGQRALTYDSIKKLAESIQKPPYQLTSELLWQAYEQLERSKVRGVGPQRLLTNIVSLIRFAVGEYEILEPFSETVNHRFEGWLLGQAKAGNRFTLEQLEWLSMIKDNVAASLHMLPEDFEYSPFYEKGGVLRAQQLFGAELPQMLEELSTVLTR